MFRVSSPSIISLVGSTIRSTKNSDILEIRILEFEARGRCQAIISNDLSNATNTYLCYQVHSVSIGEMKRLMCTVSGQYVHLNKV